MSWGFEIFRAGFVAFGTMELLTNLSYLIKENGLESARKQHQEIPRNVTQKQLKTKIVLMLLIGLLFSTSGIYAYIIRGIPSTLFIFSLAVLVIYALLEALYYRYCKTIGFATISLILLIIFSILSSQVHNPV